ncbi:MAG: hypothetical protein IPN34_00485 [Planctomycetes bacterium]|nr:hypothetical protein [Planctomycetota bacterium]
MHSEPRDDYVLHLSLPTDLEDFVRERTLASGISTSDYVLQLILEDRRRNSDRRLEELLLAGMRSEATVEVDSAYWERRRRELEARTRARSNE